MHISRIVLSTLALSAALSAGCRTSTFAIAPASLPGGSATYEHAGRSFVAPPGGQLEWPTTDEAKVSWKDGLAMLGIDAVYSTGTEYSDENTREVADASFPEMRGHPLLKDSEGGFVVYCLEGDPKPAKDATLRLVGCLRVQQGSRIVVVSTFVAVEELYAQLGGPRVAAQAALTANGFQPTDHPSDEDAD